MVNGGVRQGRGQVCAGRKAANLLTF